MKMAFINTAKTKATINDTMDYAILMYSDENVSVVVDNLNLVGDAGGFYTCGNNKGSNVVIRNSNLSSLDTGAYLAGGYNYTFENSTFTGLTGLLAKSGTYFINNCTFTGTKEYTAPIYNGNGGDSTGSAILFEPTKGYTPVLNVTIKNSTMISKYGYSIELSNQAPEGQTCDYNATVVEENNVYKVSKK